MNDGVVLYRGPLDNEAGLDALSLVMFQLESAMDYPPMAGVAAGVRLWDSIVCGRGDIPLPRLIRVDSNQNTARLSAYIINTNRKSGRYSGRLCVAPSNRTWKLANGRHMAAGGEGACSVTVRLYGLVFVCVLPEEELPPPMKFPQLRRAAETVADKSRDLWAAVVEWVRDTPAK